MANVSGIPVWRELGATPRSTQADTDKTAILIVGAGPIGLAMALDLGKRGHSLIVVSKFDFIPAASKAICWSKRSLEICDRLGFGDRLVEKGVTWNTGKVFWGEREEPVYQFDLLPTKNQKRPAFVNLQQYYFEEFALEALKALPNVDLRFGHEVIGLNGTAANAEVTVACPNGEYKITTDWLLACDGNKSTIRALLGLDFIGRVFEDNFLIADVKMKGERPSERWFWFDPPFNRGRSALMHKQPDDIWRLDFQLGWDIDREQASRPENVEPFIRALLGEDVEFEEEWYSVYTFQCRRMEKFRHGRIFFLGDSAHLVSPFGARGGNGGLADIYNLGWKLDLVLNGEAPDSLLDSYNDESIVTADENILNSTRSTDFLTPKSLTSQVFRDSILSLAENYEFARPMVNSGRLSTAVPYPASYLNTTDADIWDGGVAPGSAAIDAPLDGGWLLDQLGDKFVILANSWRGAPPDDTVVIDLVQSNASELVKERYALEAGSAYLIRPDQYVAGRWRNPSPPLIRDALNRAKGHL